MKDMAMTGTQLFVLSLALIIAVLVVLLVALKSKIPATVELSIQKALSLKVSLTPAEKDKAAKDTAKAADARGLPSKAAADAIRSKLSDVQHVPLKRVLWVDDNPDIICTNRSR
jgi:hypothetical protein